MTAATKRRSERGAALLLAMVILTLVATLAAGMVWQQSRAVQVESAERGSLQAQWILDGALDWARLILREDTRTGGADHLGEPWATPLAEARLSTFLAVDRENNTDTGPEAFLSGRIDDAQAAYNLQNLIDGEGKIVPVELRALQRLCDAAGVPTDTPGRIAEGLRAARAGSAATTDQPGAPDVPLLPARVAQLTWLGLDSATVGRLAPYLTILPSNTVVNANTAPRQVLVAAIDGLDPGTAERLVQARQREPFTSLEMIQQQLPEGVKADDKRIGVNSRFFLVTGRLRLEDRIIEEQSLLERRGAERGLEVVALRRERHSVLAADR